MLRKGSGTLCEALLMVQSCTKDVICPNKQIDPLVKFHDGHLLESETYIGGKIECLEWGIYRLDVEYKFYLKSNAFQRLIDNLDWDLALYKLDLKSNAFQRLSKNDDRNLAFALKQMVG